MDATLHRFVRYLRLRGMRVSVGELLDGVRAAQAIGLTDRQTLRTALAVTLVKQRADGPVFAEAFDRFFRLRPMRDAPGGHGHDHAHDDLTDELEAQRFTLSETPSQTPQSGHDHGRPDDIRDYFDPADLAQQYNLHQPAEKIDLAGMTDEIVLAKDQPERDTPAGMTVRVEVSRLRDAKSVRDLVRQHGAALDVELGVVARERLLDWLASGDDGGLPPELADALAARMIGTAHNLPELLAAYLEKFFELDTPAVDTGLVAPSFVDPVGETERAELQDAVRRLARPLSGGRTHRRTTAARGRMDVARTMRRNMRYDGVPFRPVHVTTRQDRPRLVVLADVSLSVRKAARFTLHLAHQLQNAFPGVRSFAFVSDLVEVTDLLEDNPVEHALGLVFGGEVLDTAADSDYGNALRQFTTEHITAVTRRSTVIVLGDGRGNGRDPATEALETIRRQCRQLIWLSPEPRYSWGLGRCDLRSYQELCDVVEEVCDVDGLERLATELLGRGRRRW